MMGQKIGSTDYVVVQELHIDEAILVIGHNQNMDGNDLSTPYATWEANSEMNSFYWGHYFKDKYSAERDLVKRSMDKVRFYDRMHGIEQSERDTR